jgi:hypothetical protein
MPFCPFIVRRPLVEFQPGLPPSLRNSLPQWSLRDFPPCFCKHAFDDDALGAGRRGLPQAAAVPLLQARAFLRRAVRVHPRLGHVRPADPEGRAHRSPGGVDAGAAGEEEEAPDPPPVVVRLRIERCRAFDTTLKKTLMLLSPSLHLSRWGCWPSLCDLAARLSAQSNLDSV